MKIEATALYEWQFTGATTTTPPAGWSPNAATSVPGETGATNTVTQAYVRMHYKGQSATIGTLGHDNAWGYGYPSTETGADQNALDNSGEKTVNGVATARKAGYDGAPSEAGKYRVTLVDWNAETSNFNLVADTGHNEYLDFEIKQKELKKPDAATAPTGKGTYDGTEQTYTISAKADGSYTYKMSLFTAGKAVNGVFDDSSLVDDLTAGTADDTKKEYKVTTAGTYKVALRLPLDSSYDASGKPNGTKPRNYKWENETKDYIEVEVELKQKELQVNWLFQSETDASANPPVAPGGINSTYKANVKGYLSTEWRGQNKPVAERDEQGNEVQEDGQTKYEEPVLQYYYKYITDKKDGSGTVVVDSAHTITIGADFKLQDLAYNGTLSTVVL